MHRKIIGFMLVLLLMTVFFHPSTTNAASELDKEAVDRYVAEYVDKNGLPGASIVIVKDGEVVHENGYGQDSDGQPITENSLMRIASVSKSFTAFSVLQLADQEKIDLDDPVKMHLEKLTLDDPRLEDITIRHLLSQTSGLPNPVIIPPADTLPEQIENLRTWKLQSNPGEKHYYSNANYWILARVVEKVSGMEFSAYLKKEVFAPLGMDESFNTIKSTEAADGLAQGYVTAYGIAMPWSSLEQMISGSGGIVTTAADMGKWLSMHTSEGQNASGEQVLSKALLDESYSPQTGSGKYGLGWSLSSPDVEPARISHSGALTNFQAQQDIVPSSGYAVAVLLNSFTPTFEHAYEISSGIIQLTEGQEPEIGASMPTIIDLSLGLITLVYVALGIRGIMRSKKWTEKRKHQKAWRFYLRLLPQLIAVIGIGWLFFIVPSLQDNSSTIKDVFGLWPAAMFFLAVIFLIACAVTVRRIYYRVALK